MNFERIPSDAESSDAHPFERSLTFDEWIGGPLKPNDLLTTSVGESERLLKQLEVHYELSLCVPEKPLGGTTFVPAEYRIEVMDPSAPDKPAPETYVRFVFDTLREAK